MPPTQKKNFNFNVKRPLGPDEAAAAATSALVSLAAAWLQVASCFLLPLLLPGLLRTASGSYFLVSSQLKGKLIGCSVPGKLKANKNCCLLEVGPDG